MTRALLPFLEVKRRPNGRVRTYRCRLLRRKRGRVALLYVLPRSGRVATLVLPAGTRTIAHYWTAQAYNVYHWLTGEGGTLGVYFNVCRDTRIGTDRVEWTDLGLDLLIVPGNRPRWIDEAETAVLESADRARAAAARRLLDERCPQLVRWVERERAELWSIVAGAGAPARREALLRA